MFLCKVYICTAELSMEYELQILFVASLSAKIISSSFPPIFLLVFPLCLL